MNRSFKNKTVIVLFCFFSLLIFVLFSISYMGHLAYSRPIWHIEINSSDQSVKALSEEAEYRFTEELHRVRPSGARWVLRIPQEALNAWLASRLDEWLVHQSQNKWPEGVGRPQIFCKNNDLKVGVEIETGLAGPNRKHWLVLVAETVFEKGNIGLEIKSIRLGRLPFGVSVERALREFVTPDKRVKIKFSLESLFIRAVIDLADGRQVHCIGARPQDGHLELELETKLSPDLKF